MKYACALVLSAGCLIQAAEPQAAQIDRVFERLDRTNSPGCALGVVRDGKLVYTRGYGMADLDHDIANTPRTVFHVASVSKQITAAAVVLLAQRGLLNLDDPARKYIPELPDFGTPVTIRHLIHNVSGLRDQWSLLVFSGWRLSEDVVRDEDVLDLVARMKALNFKPGEMTLYSNTGYTLLGQIVKRVSGRSLRQFTTEEIFQPLGMKDTHFRDDHQEIVKGMAYGYAQTGGVWRRSIPHYDTVGASSLLTTVEDWAKWDRNFDEPKAGGKALIEQMMQPFTLNSGEKTDYRFGLVTGKYRGLSTVSHGGADAGYRSHYVRFPEQKLSVTCLCNAVVDPAAFSRDVAALYLADRMEPAPVRAGAAPQVDLPLTELEKAAGLYWNERNEEVMRLRLADGKLSLSIGARGELVPTGPGRFRQGNEPMEITATGDELIVMAPGMRQPDRFKRVPEWKPNAAELARLAGSYYSEEIDSTYRLEVREGHLKLTRKKLRTHDVEPTFEDSLYIRFLGFARIDRAPDGSVSGFRLTEGRIRNLAFKRLP
jgi:CubicO group peptidase (beta-lactamase class C family)